MATKKNTMTQVKKTRKHVIDTIKSFNDNLIDIADVLIDETTASTAKYQKIAAKAIKKSEPIVQKNVEMIIDSAELMYQQYSSGSKKLQKLLGITKQVKNARKTFDKTVDSIEKNVKSLRNNIEEAAEDVEKRTKKIVKKVQKTA
jgi:gas vesicle protein